MDVKNAIIEKYSSHFTIKEKCIKTISWYCSNIDLQKYLNYYVSNKHNTLSFTLNKAISIAVFLSLQLLRYYE